MPRLGPWWLLGAGVLGGIVVAALGAVRTGGSIAAVAFFVAALVRATVSEARSGGLHIRSRPLDVAMFLAMGAVVLLATLLVKMDGNP